MNNRKKAIINLYYIGFITGKRDFNKAWKRYWKMLLTGKDDLFIKPKDSRVRNDKN